MYRGTLVPEKQQPAWINNKEEELGLYALVIAPLSSLCPLKHCLASYTVHGDTAEQWNVDQTKVTSRSIRHSDAFLHVIGGVVGVYGLP